MNNEAYEGLIVILLCNLYQDSLDTCVNSMLPLSLSLTAFFESSYFSYASMLFCDLNYYILCELITSNYYSPFASAG